MALNKKGNKNFDMIENLVMFETLFQQISSNVVLSSTYVQVTEEEPSCFEIFRIFVTPLHLSQMITIPYATLVNEKYHNTVFDKKFFVVYLIH